MQLTWRNTGYLFSDQLPGYRFGNEAEQDHGAHLEAEVFRGKMRVEVHQTLVFGSIQPLRGWGSMQRPEPRAWSSGTLLDVTVGTV